ncbi:MAG: hypothetical protein KDK51_06365 [Deltaproteobacteria bacterium]|nr:hypothetical protein [Deltaproteobacteria bacterium]
MFKQTITMIMLSSFFLAPAFARGKGQMRQDNNDNQAMLQSLNDAQKSALQKYRSAMHAFHEERKGDKGQKSQEMDNHKEQAKAAFVQGDFAKLETLRDQHKQAWQEKKIKAMQDAFGSLSNKDREALAQFVLQERRHRRQKRQFSDKDNQE